MMFSRRSVAGLEHIVESGWADVVGLGSLFMVMR